MMLTNSRIVQIPSQTPTLLHIQFDKAYNNFPHSSNNFKPRTLIKVSSSSSSASSSLTSGDRKAVIAPTQPRHAVEVIRSFYAAINGHDFASIQLLIAENCVYEDLMFARPFVGRKEFVEGYKNFIDSMSMDLQLVFDDTTSNEDSSTVGVTWHFEWKGKEFPCSRGCSFYRLQMVDGRRQIVYGRDVAEHSIKLGKVAVVAMKGITWLLQQFPQLEDQLIKETTNARYIRK